MRLKATDYYRHFRNSPVMPYACLFLAAVITQFLQKLLYPCGIMTPDSDSYITASHILCEGQLDIERTPVLPLVIALSRAIFGEGLQIFGLLVIQSVVFLISILYFKLTASNLIPHKRVVFWGSAIYAMFPGFFFYNKYVLTESLAVSFVVFFAWTLLGRSPGRQKIRHVMLSSLWLFLLIYLRPVMLCLVPVFIIYWATVAIRRKAFRLGSAAMASLVFTGISLMAYKAEIKRLYQIDSVSSVSVINSYFLAREARLLQPEFTDNPILKAHLDSVKDKEVRNFVYVDFNEFFAIRDSLGSTGFPELEKTINRALKSNPAKLVRPMVDHLHYAELSPLFNLPLDFHTNIVSHITLNFYFVFMAVTFLWLIVRRKGLEPWTMWLISAGIAGASVVGAMSGWTRLMLPGMSAAFLILMYMLAHWRLKYHSGTEISGK